MKKFYCLTFAAFLLLSTGCGINSDANPNVQGETHISVESTSPADSATGVQRNITLTIRFNKDADGSTVSASSILVKKDSTDISGAVTYANRTATFKPSTNLDYNTLYDVTVKGSVKDIEGKSMGEDYTFSFTTVDASTVSNPVFNPIEGTYETSQNVSITSDSGSTIKYTLDESTPSRTHGSTFSTPVVINSNMTVTAMAYKTGSNDSGVSTAVYIFKDKVAKPVFNPAPGTYSSDQSVTISCTASDKIYYTTNGDDPTTSSDEYTSPISVAGHGTNITIKAIAIKNGMSNSPIASAQYIINNSTATVSHLAGTTGGHGAVDGTGTDARFKISSGITSDGTNLYVVDTFNNTIRKIVISSGAVTTMAGSPGSQGSTNGTGTDARFFNPCGITTDGTNLYVADTDNHSIRKIVISTGVVTTLAGAGHSGSDNGKGAIAHFNKPCGITNDGTFLYVADSENCTIRKIDISTGIVTTFAGEARMSGITDGTLIDARFYSPYGITKDGDNLFITDKSNHTIRKIAISTGIVSTLAGTAKSSGSIDAATGTSAKFNYPQGIESDGTNLYVADTNNHTIRKIVISSGAVSTLTGTAESEGFSDGTVSEARFYFPSCIAINNGNLYVTDSWNNTIRKIDISSNPNTVSTYAGTANSFGSADATGSDARFYEPRALTSDGTNLYVADTENHTIRKIVIATGAVSTFAGAAGMRGSADSAIGTNARFRFPYGITNDGTNLYVADTENHTIRKIVIATGAVSTLAGAAGEQGSTDSDTGTNARFRAPFGITNDGTNLYVADTYNHTIRKIVISTAVVSTFAGTTGTKGTINDTLHAASFNFPTGITFDGTNFYVADKSNHSIRKINVSTNRVSTFAGTSGTTGTANGTGTAARFNFPYDITSDGTNLYVADTLNHTIRKIVISNQVVTTIAGIAGTNGSKNGTATTATFLNPSGITFKNSVLYVSDTENNSIRRITNP